jgi:hypothetical protein
MGVEVVTNDIKIASETNNEIEKKNIELAITHNWSLSRHHIKVATSGKCNLCF